MIQAVFTKPFIQNTCLCFIALLILFGTPIKAAESVSNSRIENPIIMEKPIIVVGADHSYPPYEFVNQYGEPDGYNVELTLAIADLMGFEVEFRMSDWKTALKGLYQEDVDVLQGIAYSVIRAQTILFSPPVFRLKMVVSPKDPGFE